MVLRTIPSKFSTLQEYHSRASSHTQAFCIQTVPRRLQQQLSILIIWCWRLPRALTIMSTCSPARRRRVWRGMGLFECIPAYFRLAFFPMPCAFDSIFRWFKASTRLNFDAYIDFSVHGRPFESSNKECINVRRDGRNGWSWLAFHVGHIGRGSGRRHGGNRPSELIM